MVHHGKENNRIYLIGFDDRDRHIIVGALALLARKNGYDKIVVKVPESAARVFLDAGYATEAIVPGYFGGAEDCLFLSLFLSGERKTAMDLTQLQGIIQKAREKQYSRPGPLAEGYGIQAMERGMCEEMARLYRRVFKSYPYPIFDPQYLMKTMEDNIAYFGALFDGKLVAVASGEMNQKYKNAEMTDFAIDPQHRGKKLAKHLLAATEEDMEKRGIRTLYTIARAGSLPMNCTFAGMGYSFGGTLINNTQIAGNIESMNVWHKNK